MREIKFRGRRLDTGEWHYGDLTTNKISHRFSGDTCIFDGSWHVVDPSTVGQCTGLKDRNGNSIYESDILCLYDAPLWVVRWGDGRWESQFGCGLFCGNVIKREVVGNIHDNPELLGNNL